jgi:microcystin-dependent protein
MDPYVAEIRIFAGNFAPRGWAFCNGQLLPISKNTALFSLIGTTYGGDGKTNFALPNLQGSIPIQQGQGSGSLYYLGETGGSPIVTLTANEIPRHNHTLQADPQPGNSSQPIGSNPMALARSGATNIYYNSNPGEQMNQQALSNAGGSQPHNNLQPYLALNFIIALQGVYPPRN